MKYYLVKFHRNWADEFDCDGFSVITEEEKTNTEKLVSHDLIKDRDVNFSFGTNEGWEGDFTFSKLWKDVLKFEEISEDEYNTIRKLFLPKTSYKRSYGIFPEIPDLLDGIIYDMEEDGEDEETIEEIDALLETLYS
jgi:hypothetical protein